MNWACLVDSLLQSGLPAPPHITMEIGNPMGVWDEDVNTKLHATSLCGHLQHGANEDAVDAENRSPLHWAGVCRGLMGTGLQGLQGGKWEV